MYARSTTLTADPSRMDEGIAHVRDHADDDACARVTWTRGNPARVEEMIEAFRTGIIPRLDDVRGFCSLSLMIDRGTGRGVVTSVYDDRADMDASRRHGRRHAR